MIVSGGNRQLIGSKGFELYRCTLLGVNVPSFRILTTDCLVKYSVSEFDEGLLDRLEDLLDEMGGKVAVRSSSVAEDGSERSNAGIFKTVLNVDSPERMIKAIRDVWSSANGQDMAVIIQKQLDPEVSGVLFTRNPINGNEWTVIEYVKGLCSSLVSGRVDPKRILVKNSDRSLQTLKMEEKRIDLGPLLKTSTFLESKLGYPLDIEWAFCDNEFHILQVRPITSLPPPGKEGSRTYSRVQADQFYSGPVTPLFFSVFQQIYTRYYIAETIEELGISIDIDDNFLIRYRSHIFADTRIIEYGLASLPTRNGIEHIWETVPEDIRGGLRNGHKLSPLNTLWKVLSYVLLHRNCWISRLDEHFKQEVVPGIHSRLFELQDPLSLDNKQLLDHYDRLMDVVKLHVRSSKWGMALYTIPLTGAASHLLQKNALLGFLPDIMSGFAENPTMEASSGLRILADRARSNNEILDILALERNNYQDYEKELREISSGDRFIEFFENHLSIFGHRRISRDFHDPSWNDDPDIPFSIVRQLSLSPCQDHGEPEMERAIRRRHRAYRKVILELPFRERWLFSRVYRYLVRYVQFRELQRFYLDLILARMKGLFVEISKRMVHEGELDDVGDIFFLDLGSVKKWLGGKSENRLRNESLFNRVSFENEKDTPGRYLRNGISFDSIDRIGKGTDIPEGVIIKGEPVASGVHEGKIVVMKGLNKDLRLNRGDILVTEHIDPGQTHLFLLAGALVLEVGGLLSHGAILAREFNIPTVAGVKNAVKIFRDGQEAVIDGNSGTVTILKQS